MSDAVRQAEGARGARLDPDLRHALRTPLNHIIGYSELLIEQADADGLEDMARDLERIRAAGRHLVDLLDGIARGDAPAGDHAVAPGAVSAGPNESPERAANGTRLLVVDDDEGNRDIVRRLLESVGYAVDTAPDGARALQMLESDPFDLVLLDVMMPVMDGIEACRRIRAGRGTALVPVVIMTALGEVGDRVRGILAGADDFLTKPVHRDELLARIQTSLTLRRRVEERFDRLRGAQEFLARFVPHWVTRHIEETGEVPAFEKTHRDMSAMFVDVTGYTRLSERMGQAADHLLEKYFARYLDVIRGFGGDITETSGDGIMAIFPGEDPIVHARAAVHSALDILEQTRELNVRLDGLFEPIEVHIGVNSGIAAIGPTRFEGATSSRWTYTALGAPVNLAARIAQFAGGQMVCVGAETARRLGDGFELRDAGRHALKNVEGEVAIIEVVAARDPRGG